MYVPVCFECCIAVDVRGVLEIKFEMKFIFSYLKLFNIMLRLVYTIEVSVII